MFIGTNKLACHNHTQSAGKADTEIPTIIDPKATINYPSATGSIFVGFSVRKNACVVHWVSIPDLA